MATHSIWAYKTVGISELRNKPADYFTDEPVAVLSNNRPTGYVIGAEAYEAMMKVIEQYNREHGIEARFRPTADRLQEIGRRGSEIVDTANESDLDQFTECP